MATSVLFRLIAKNQVKQKGNAIILMMMMMMMVMKMMMKIVFSYRLLIVMVEV